MFTIKNKNLFFVFVVMALAILISSKVYSQFNPSQLKFKPIKFTPPKVERKVLSNGIILYLLEDHELPIINLHSKIRTGSIYDPTDKIGLANITGKVIRTGGTKNRTANQINEELEFIASTVEVSIELESGTATLSSLPRNFDKTLEIFADVLMNPVFDEKIVNIEKAKMIEEIKRQNDVPDKILDREFKKLIYGNHPYAQTPTIQTVQNITRNDLIEFHKKYYHPNNIIIGISGDFKTDEMVKKIEKAFSNWKKAEIIFPQIQPIELKYEKSVNLIDKKINQTNIAMGHLGIKLHNPDKFPLMVMDYIFGGSGTSRLNNEIRSSRGLAYSVYSYFATRSNDYGFLGIECQTKSESTAEVISIIKDEINKIRETPVTDEELTLAKEYLINTFIFAYSTTGDIIKQKVSLEYGKYPQDYMETWCDKISAVTKEDILRVAKEYIKPEGMIILAVGDPTNFDKPLSTFGEVKIINLKEP